MKRPDESSWKTGEELRKEMYLDRFEQVLKSLTYRERGIIKLRYGMEDDEYVYTQEQVGSIFKLSPSRISQIEAKAIHKLQHPVRARKLRELGLLGWYARRTMPDEMPRLCQKIVPESLSDSGD